MLLVVDIGTLELRAAELHWTTSLPLKIFDTRPMALEDS